MDNNSLNKSKIKKSPVNKKTYENNDGDSAIENNKNDLVSNQGSSGILDFNMENKKSKIEKAYVLRKERFDRDEENPMYDDSDEPFGAPDRF